MRDYSEVDRYLNILLGDIYDQPPDAGHTAMARDVIHNWIPQLIGCKSVLDVGCGEIAPQADFEMYGIDYTGIALGKDAIVSQAAGKNVLEMDMTFTTFEDESFDLIYVRHVLEHSPMPLITLMEWNRIGRSWLCVVLPNPIHYGWAGRNHYSVLHPNQAEFLFERAGWHIIWDDFSEPTELRYMCEKKRTSRYDAYMKTHLAIPVEAV